MVQHSKFIILFMLVLGCGIAAAGEGHPAVPMAPEEESLPMAPQSYDELGGQQQHVFAPVGAERLAAPATSAPSSQAAANTGVDVEPAATAQKASGGKSASAAKIATKGNQPARATAATKRSPKASTKGAQTAANQTKKGGARSLAKVAKKASAKSKASPKRAVASKQAPAKPKKSKKAK